MIRTTIPLALLLALGGLAACSGDAGGGKGGGTGGAIEGAGGAGGDAGGGPIGTGGAGGVGGAGGTAGSGAVGTGGSGGSTPAEGLSCNGSTCQCSDGQDNDGDGLADEFDPECSGPYDNDEATYATGIPGDNKGSKAGTECFFDGNSGTGNDAMCRDWTPNGCDCFGCCWIDLNGNGTAEQVGMFSPGCATSRDPDAAPGTAGAACATDDDCEGSLHCLLDGDGATAFCTACVACEQDEECNNPCEEGENCIGEEPGTSNGGGTPVCPEGRQACTATADCAGPNEFCVTGCCTVFE